MKPSELTIEVVREELSSLIERFPDRKGIAMVESKYVDSDVEGAELVPSCVYYTDMSGSPASVGDYYRDVANTYGEVESKLINPVCIIGQWIEDFHSDYKEDDIIKSVLYRNTTMRSLFERESSPFPRDVTQLLARVQDTQDDRNNTWKDIEL